MQHLLKPVPAFEQLLKLEKIEQKDLAILSDKEKDEFIKILHWKAMELAGYELNRFMEQAAALLDKDFIWELNHYRIADAIKIYQANHGAMPTKTHIAMFSGLSRKTVREHLNDFANRPVGAGHKGEVNVIIERVIGQVSILADNGDLKAAKILLDYAQKLNGAAGAVNNQNNFIQINETVINQQVLQQLKPEILRQIEEIIEANREGMGEG